MESEGVRAAEYMRMSTEHQQYSIANQSAAIQEYADKHSIEIVRTYVDRGKSGLDLKRRPDLQSLLRTVTSGEADFSLVLVYDVSRWGRFQDVDESAYYEFELKRAGVPVIYCAEPFIGAGGPTGALLKALKRAMAAEYSRELSIKVAQGQQRIARLGFRLGGLGGFGLRRVAIDPGGSRRIVLEDGERKGIKTDRVTLTPGPAEETAVVQTVFDLFVKGGLGETAIAKRLNARGIRTTRGFAWTREPVFRMLRNPKYVGDLAFNRTVTTIGSPPAPNPRDKWIVLPNQFPGIVSRDVWDRAQETFAKRAARVTESVMLAQLQALLAKHGRLSYELISAEPGMMSPQAYHARFGSITEAYRRVGWSTSKRGIQTTRRPEVRRAAANLESAFSTRIAETCDCFSKDPKRPLWKINDELTLCARLLIPIQQPRRKTVWKMQRRSEGNVLVLARLNLDLNAILDYYLFLGHRPPVIRIFEQNPWSLDMYRFEDLSFLDLLCGRSTLSEAGGMDAQL